MLSEIFGYFLFLIERTLCMFSKIVFHIKILYYI